MKKNNLRTGLKVTVYKEGKDPQVGWVHRFTEDLMVLQTRGGEKEYLLKEVIIKRHPILTIVNKLYTWLSS